MSLTANDEAKLEERFRQESFELLPNSNILTTIFKPKVAPYRLHYLLSPWLDLEWQIIAVVMETAAFAVFYFYFEWSLTMSLTAICFMYFFTLTYRWGMHAVVKHKVRKAMIAKYHRLRYPTIDQIHRVGSVSRWMTIVGTLGMEDGRIVVVIKARAIKHLLYAVDLYRLPKRDR